MVVARPDGSSAPTQSSGEPLIVIDRVGKTYTNGTVALEEISFDAADYEGQTVGIDRSFVAERVGEVAADDDLSNFIL